MAEKGNRKYAVFNAQKGSQRIPVPSDQMSGARWFTDEQKARLFPFTWPL